MLLVVSEGLSALWLLAPEVCSRVFVMESVYRSSETEASIIGFQWLIRLGLDLETKS